jgi:hypothetical protein
MGKHSRGSRDSMGKHSRGSRGKHSRGSRGSRGKGRVTRIRKVHHLRKWCSWETRNRNAHLGYSVSAVGAVVLAYEGIDLGHDRAVVADDKLIALRG